MIKTDRVSSRQCITWSNRIHDPLSASPFGWTRFPYWFISSSSCNLLPALQYAAPASLFWKIKSRTTFRQRDFFPFSCSIMFVGSLCAQKLFFRHQSNRQQRNRCRRRRRSGGKREDGRISLSVSHSESIWVDWLIIREGSIKNQNAVEEEVVFLGRRFYGFRRKRHDKKEKKKRKKRHPDWNCMGPSVRLVDAQEVKPL